SPCVANACIDVKLSKDTSLFFASIFPGINAPTVHGHALAVIGSPGSVKNVAAIVVNQTLACKTDDQNCFGPSHTKDLNFDGAPGAGAAAGLVDLKGHNLDSTKCTASASAA